MFEADRAVGQFQKRLSAIVAAVKFGHVKHSNILAVANTITHPLLQ